MNRFVLLIGGVLLFLHLIELMPVNVQVGLFIAGVLLVGVPHGAADLLVGLQNAKEEQRVQTRWRFLSGYLAKLVLFGLLFYVFPTAGLLLFFVLAAFHFGETDLNRFDTDAFSGKCFVLSYGLLIIGFILLIHLDEAGPLLTALGADAAGMETLAWLEQRKGFILTLLLLFFFTATFVHLLRRPGDAKKQDLFLWRLVALLVLLYNLPLLLGFFFYFVVWHSVLSLSNIVGYLQKAGGARTRNITLTMFAYSIATFAGIAVLSFFFRTVLTQQALITVAFAALAVLTAPHMMVMHHMYSHLRKRFFS